jgi:hypothetical protein
MQLVHQSASAGLGNQGPQRRPAYRHVPGLGGLGGAGPGPSEDGHPNGLAWGRASARLTAWGIQAARAVGSSGWAGQSCQRRIGNYVLHKCCNEGGSGFVRNAPTLARRRIPAILNMTRPVSSPAAGDEVSN